jgi:AcrR family transcriptional regulator
MGKQENILEATKQLIIEQGFKDISVRDIKEKAGIAQGTIYVYFKSKEEIFAAIVENFFSEADKFIKETKKIKKDSSSKIKAFVKADLMFYERNHDLFNALGREMESIKNMCSAEYHQKILKKYFQIINSISEIIEEGITEKKIKKVTPTEGALVLVSIIHAYAGMRVHKLSDKPLTEQSKKITDIFLKGVGR